MTPGNHKMLVGLADSYRLSLPKPMTTAQRVELAIIRCNAAEFLKDRACLISRDSRISFVPDSTVSIHINSETKKS